TPHAHQHMIAHHVRTWSEKYNPDALSKIAQDLIRNVNNPRPVLNTLRDAGLIRDADHPDAPFVIYNHARYIGLQSTERQKKCSLNNDVYPLKDFVSELGDLLPSSFLAASPRKGDVFPEDFALDQEASELEQKLIFADTFQEIARLGDDQITQQHY